MAEKTHKNEVTARLRYLRMTPRKVRTVARTIAGQQVQVALDALQFTPRAAAGPLYKLVRSAVSNAAQKGGIDVDTLYVKKIAVDAGPTLKRFRPRSRGRADRLLRRTSHITVVLAEKV